MKSKTPIVLLAVALGLATGGCKAPIGAAPVTTRRAYEQARETALGDGKPGAATLAILHRYDLDRLATKRPGEAVRQLHHKALASGERDLLFALAEMSYLAGDRIRRSVKPWDARDARDYYLGCAAYAWLFLFGEGKEPPLGFLDPRVRESCDYYNYAVGLALCESRTTNGVIRFEAGRRRLPVGEIEMKLDLANFPDPLEDFDQFLLADRFRVRSLSVRNREPGVGTPLLAVRRFDAELGLRRSLPATALLRLPGSLAEVDAGTGYGSLELYSAFDEPQVTIGNRQVPLEIDLTTHMAYVLNQSRVWDLGMLQFLSPPKNVRCQLIPFHRFRPDRIPVVYVHGTFSSPVAWAELSNTLVADPALRQRYQVWAFMYPSGGPLPISAAGLRDALTAKIRELDPAATNALLRQMVVLGHSQGGLLTKLTATSTGDRMWRAFSDKPLEEFPVDETERTRLRRLLFLEPLPFVRRVVFISTPHRGSYLATSFTRRLAAALMSPSSATEKVIPESTSMFEGTRVERMLNGRVPTSLDSMSPKNPVLLALSDIPVAPTIKAHSIIPVKGRGDLQKARDGVVAYTSAHVDQVESELVVRGEHSCQNLPVTIEEVRRILREHLSQLDSERSSNQKGDDSHGPE